jgi:hypothetical protein
MVVMERLPQPVEQQADFFPFAPGVVENGHQGVHGVQHDPLCSRKTRLPLNQGQQSPGIEIPGHDGIDRHFRMDDSEFGLVLEDCGIHAHCGGVGPDVLGTLFKGDEQSGMTFQGPAVQELQGQDGLARTGHAAEYGRAAFWKAALEDTVQSADIGGNLGYGSVCRQAGRDPFRRHGNSPWIQQKISGQMTSVECARRVRGDYSKKVSIGNITQIAVICKR